MFDIGIVASATGTPLQGDSGERGGTLLDSSGVEIPLLSIPDPVDTPCRAARRGTAMARVRLLTTIGRLRVWDGRPIRRTKRTRLESNERGGVPSFIIDKIAIYRIDPGVQVNWKKNPRNPNDSTPEPIDWESHGRIWPQQLGCSLP